MKSGNLYMTESTIRDSRVPAVTAVLTLHLPQRYLPRCFPFLQEGFLVQIPGGGSIRTALCRDLGLKPEYLEGRIQTIFLNGKPVDDVDAAVVAAGDTLALSAAMPGLVGATMRRGGFFAGLRASISHQGGTEVGSQEACLVRLKLFNLLIGELGPIFLERGLLLQAAGLGAFLQSQPADFWAAGLGASLNGKDLAFQALPTMTWPNGEDLVCLRVTSGPADGAREAAHV